MRDLLRKRMHLVKLRTSLIISLKNIISRNGGHVPTHRIKQLGCDHVSPLLGGDEALALSGRVSKETIDYLTGQISKVEKSVRLS